MRSRLALAFALALGACAVLPAGERPETLFNDRLFAPPSETMSAGAVFAVNDAMRHYLRVGSPRSSSRSAGRRASTRRSTPAAS